MERIELSVNGKKFNDYETLMAEKESLKSLVGKTEESIMTSDGYETRNGVYTSYKLVLESQNTWGYIVGVFNNEFINNPDWEKFAKELDEISGLTLLRVFKIRNEDFSIKIYENTGLIRLLQDNELTHTAYDNDIFINILTDTRLYKNGFTQKFSEFLNKYFVSFNGKTLENIHNFLDMAADNDRYSFGKLVKSKCCNCNGSPAGTAVWGMLASKFNKLGLKYSSSRNFYKDNKSLGSVEFLFPEQKIIVHCYDLLSREEAVRKKLDYALMHAGYTVIVYEASSCMIGVTEDNSIKAITSLIKNW